MLMNLTSSSWWEIGGVAYLAVAVAALRSIAHTVSRDERDQPRRPSAM